MWIPRAFLIAVGVCCGLAAQDESLPKFGTTVYLSSGLKGQIYHISDDTIFLPNFKRLKPVGAIYTKSLNIPIQSFREGFPGVTTRSEWFAIDYTGRFWIEKPGKYTFALLSDDGSKLYVDGKTVIDNDGEHAPLELQKAVMMKRGVHDIRVSYFQGPREAVALVLRVAGPGEQLRVFHTDEFKPPPDVNPEDPAIK